MSQKHHGGPGPIPPGNQSHQGPAHANAEQPQTPDDDGTGFQEQDAKRRLGGYETAGEHSIQQPSSLNDGTKHSK